MSADKEIAKKIEDKAAPKDGHVNTHVMDEILSSSGVLKDKTLASAVQNRLQEAGILPQLAIDTFSDAKTFQTFAGDNGRLSQQKLEQAAETGKVDGHDVSATSRFMADALLNRWHDIGTDGRPGISMQELKDWGARPEGKGAGAGAGADSGLRLAVMPRESATDGNGRPLEGGDRGTAEGATRPGDKSLSLPSREDILTKPVSELKDWLSRNGQKLEDVVEKNLSALQKNQIGFHGTSKEGMDGINQNHEAKESSTRKMFDGTPSHEMYVATPSHLAADAKEWIANIGRSVEKAVDYAKDGGGIAVIDMGAMSKSGIAPNGDYRGVNKHGDDSNDSHPSRNPYQPTPEKWGETDPQVNKENFAERMKGWLDPSKWSGLADKSDPSSGEQKDRNDLAKAFERQGAVKEVLSKLGIHVPEAGSEAQSREQQRPAEQISFDDFMKKISPALKNVTDCHKLWQLITGESPAGAAPTGEVRLGKGFPKTHPEQNAPADAAPTGKYPEVRTRGFHKTDPEGSAAAAPPTGKYPEVRTRGFHKAAPEQTPVAETPTNRTETPANRTETPAANRTEARSEPRNGEAARSEGQDHVDPRWQQGTIPQWLHALHLPDLPKMNLAPKELKQLVHDGMQAADSLIHSGNQQQQSRGLADSPAWRNLKVGLEKAGLIPLDQPPARPGAAGGDPSARPVRGDPPPRPGQEQRDSPEQARAQGDSPERQGGALDRQAAWGKLADKWDLSGEWAKFKQVPAEELGQVVNKGIQDAATARNMQALQEWSNFRRDLIDAGLMRDDKPRSPVKEKKIEGPVMGF